MTSRPAFKACTKNIDFSLKGKENILGRTLMWGEASDAEDNRVESRQQGPEGYTLTAIAALNIAEKILAGNVNPGFQTPAKAYGSDLVLEIAGVTRQDIS